MNTRIYFTDVLTPDNIGQLPPKKNRVLKSKVPVSHLTLSDEQHTAITEAYKTPNNPSITDIQFGNDDQAEAHRLLLAHKLGAESLEHPASKWSTQWSNGESRETYKHTLLQCYCGYHHQSRQSSTRRVPYDFTGCLAHAEVITIRATGITVRVHGMLEHNSECLHAELKRIPILELHPNVFEIALEQLNNGVTLTEIKEKNRAMVAAHQYRDQSELLGKHRYLIRHYDSRSLYIQYYRAQEINIKEQPHLNLDNWLTPGSRTYNETLARAIFHYSPRTEQSARLEVCIATDEMKKAAWLYGHQSQILLDGTFGVCDRRILLFIVMGIDEQKHGVPLAFLLFSAPAGNQATHGGYNTDILIKVLARWKDSLILYGQREFTPAVAITDTDFKERGALVQVFPDIKLLICRFHLRQRWTNHRGMCLRGNAPGYKAVRDQLVALERRLVESTNFATAIGLVNQETVSLNLMAANVMYTKAARKGIAHLKYLSSNWMTETLWEGWSDGGRFAAAKKIGVAAEGVVMTNNTLESFNGLLKNKLLNGWSRGNRRLRVDTLMFILALKVAPSIFLRRRLEEDERKMLRRALEGVPGADKLIGAGRTTHQPIEVPVAYLSPDIRRDNEARLLLQYKLLSEPTVDENGIQLTCRSIQSTNPNGAPIEYTVWLGFNAVASCTCPDFQKQGGACKHMRAALYGVRDLKSSVGDHQINNPIARIPNIELPADKPAAMRAIYAQHGLNRNTTGERGGRDDSRSGRAGSATQCLDEALGGGFSDDLDDADELDGARTVELDSEGYEEGNMSSEDDLALLSDGDESYFPSNSARGVIEQAIAQNAYAMKQQLKLIPTISAGMNHFTAQDLDNSPFRPIYEQYLQQLNALTAQMSGLLRHPVYVLPPSQTSLQEATQAPGPTQHGSHITPIPPSPERRQYRKESRGIH